MSSGGAQANLFYRDVAASRRVWFAENAEGVALEFDVDGGKVSFPLWSSESRIARLQKLDPKLLGAYRARAITWDVFTDVVAPELKRKKRLVGVNLSGPKLRGFDMPIESLIRQVEAMIARDA